MAAKRLWVEEYRPKTLDGYVFQNEQQREQINRMVLEHDIPHLLLTGTQGSGKTTLARILVAELGIDDMDLLTFNASHKTGIDWIRESVLSFAESYPVGRFKVIMMEEFDRLSHAAQAMLRDVMEANSDTCRFIAICNFEHMIMAPLKSRFQHLRFKAAARDDVLMKMAEILIAENVDFDPEVLDKYVSQAYPDIRKIINNLQLNTVDRGKMPNPGGRLGQPSQDVDGGDYLFKLLDLIIAGDLREIRKLVTEQCTAEELLGVYELLYKNIEKHPKFKDNRGLYEQALVTLCDGLYKHGLVAIPHLNFESTMIRISHTLET